MVDEIFAPTVVFNGQSIRTWRATHRGPYRGAAPTGKQVRWTQISVVRFSQGRVVEDWAVADEVVLLQQLGALSA